MTREKLKQGQEIATVLDRINRVLEVESDGNTSEEPRLSFRTSVCGADVQSLAFADFRSDFLKLLFAKKQILEKKFSEL